MLSTVLPMAWPALTKPDGRIYVGLQRTHPVRRRQPGSRPLPPAGTGHRAGPVGVTAAAARPGPAAAGRARPRGRARRHHPGRVRVLAGRGGDQPGDQGLARAGQRLGVPDRAHGRGAGGVLVPLPRARPTSGGCCPTRRTSRWPPWPDWPPRSELDLGEKTQVRRHVPRPRPARAGVGPAPRGRPRRSGSRRWSRSRNATLRRWLTGPNWTRRSVGLVRVCSPGR